ncbi:hypothetical protein LguiA_016638 [Lonicera macranthoides]
MLDSPSYIRDRGNVWTSFVCMPEAMSCSSSTFTLHLHEFRCIKYDQSAFNEGEGSSVVSVETKLHGARLVMAERVADGNDHVSFRVTVASSSSRYPVELECLYCTRRRFSLE